MDSSLIAKRVHIYRQLANLTQEELADRVSVSDTYIRKIEGGSRTPSLDLIIDLADALNTTPDHLILSSVVLSKDSEANILTIMNDCTPTEFSILYENMKGLKNLLRAYMK